jgi:hypothetical protein
MPMSSGSSTSAYPRARLIARRLSCRAGPASRHEWLRVVKMSRTFRWG